MSARALKVLTLFAATVLSACTYAPYHTGGVVRDYDYGYAGSNYSNSYYDDFYYYPRVGIYFNIHSGHYYYQHNHRWVRTRTLPRHYKLHPDHRVRMKAHRDKPYRDYHHHSQRYRGDSDQWRQRDNRDGDRRRYDRNDRNDRNDRYDRRSSQQLQSSPRRGERDWRDDRSANRLEQDYRGDRRSRNPERSREDARKAAAYQRLKNANTFEERQAIYQDALRRQEIKRARENRQSDHSNVRDRRNDARAQSSQQTWQEQRDRRERRGETRALRQSDNENARSRRDDTRVQSSQQTWQERRERRREARAQRQEPGPVERRRERLTDNDEDLRWLRQGSRDQ